MAWQEAVVQCMAWQGHEWQKAPTRLMREQHSKKALRGSICMGSSL